MATTGQIGQKSAARRWRIRLAAGAFGLSVTLAAGCSTTPTTAQQSYDPLYGVRTPPGTILPAPNAPPATGSIAPQVQPQALNSNGVPAIPTSSSSANPASLAATNWRSPLGQSTPLDNRTGPPLMPVQATSASHSLPPGAVPANPNPRTEPVPDAKPAAAATQVSQAPPPSTSPIVQTANSAPAIDYAKQLKDHGVINQKQEPKSDGLLLTCYVSTGANGGVRILEVLARDYPTAAQAILRELDQPR